MYGMTIIFAIFMLQVGVISGYLIWKDNKKRVPEKRPLHQGTLTKKLYRNYTTKVL